MRALLFVLATSTLSLAACGASDGPDADLAFADDAQLRRALAAATGADALDAHALAEALAAGDATSCPAVTIEGDTTTITGGCNGEVGPIVGRIVVESTPGDRSAMARVRFEQFGDGAWTIDGVVERSPDGARVVAELSTTVDGLAAHAQVSLACDERAVCGIAAPSTIEIDGLGTAEVLGAWRHAPLGGSLTLVGASKATFDFNAVADGCIPFTVDGGTGHRLCD